MIKLKKQIINDRYGLKSALLKGCDVHHKNQQGQSLLHRVCKFGFTELVPELIKRGIIIYLKDVFDQTAIEVAVARNNHETAKKIISYLDCNIFDLAKLFRIAANSGSSNILHFLIDEYFSKSHIRVKYLIFYAINYEDVVKRLIIECGANIDEVYNGMGVLHYASECETLIKLGANVNMEDQYRQTPLHYAAFNDNLRKAKTLIDNGAILDSENVNGLTPLCIARSHGSWLVANLLRKCGVVEKRIS